MFSLWRVHRGPPAMIEGVGSFAGVPAALAAAALMEPGHYETRNVAGELCGSVRSGDGVDKDD